MKKIILLILVSVAVYGDNVKECLSGSVEACDKVALITFDRDWVNSWRSGGRAAYSRVKPISLPCNDFMKAVRKGCNLGSGFCCAVLGDEFHSISIWDSARWVPKYGINCSLRNQNEAFKYYKKACELGESAGCQRYSELQDDLDEIDRRERDKTYKGDITIRQK